NLEIDAENIVLQVSEPSVAYELKVKTNHLTIIDNRANRQQLGGSKTTYNYILGNPPFIGKSQQKREQKEDMEHVFKGVKSFGVFDYVAAWYFKAAQLIQNSQTKVAFVSTNS